MSDKQKTKVCCKVEDAWQSQIFKSMKIQITVLGKGGKLFVLNQV